MALDLQYARLRETPRSAIHVVRVRGEILEAGDIDAIAERMREKVEARGEIATDVVVVQGDRKETLRLYVRSAMFNAALSWTPIELG